jgi:hypothetical protein
MGALITRRCALDFPHCSGERVRSIVGTEKVVHGRYKIDDVLGECVALARKR